MALNLESSLNFASSILIADRSSEEVLTKLIVQAIRNSLNVTNFAKDSGWRKAELVDQWSQGQRDCTKIRIYIGRTQVMLLKVQKVIKRNQKLAIFKRELYRISLVNDGNWYSLLQTVLWLSSKWETVVFLARPDWTFTRLQSIKCTRTLIQLNTRYPLLYSKWRHQYHTSSNIQSNVKYFNALNNGRWNIATNSNHSIYYVSNTLLI